MAKPTSPNRRRPWTEADAQRVLDEWRRGGATLILWTRGGFTIVHKRLERGTFTFPARIVDGAASVAIDVHELAMLLENIEVAQTKIKPRWDPEPRVRSTAAERSLTSIAPAHRTTCLS